MIVDGILRFVVLACSFFTDSRRNFHRACVGPDAFVASTSALFGCLVDITTIHYRIHDPPQRPFLGSNSHTSIQTALYQQPSRSFDVYPSTERDGRCFGIG